MEQFLFPLIVCTSAIPFDLSAYRTPKKQKRNTDTSLADHVATRRTKRARGDKEQTEANLDCDSKRSASDAPSLAYYATGRS